MTNWETDEFILLSNQILQSGKALPNWLEKAVLKAKEEEKERLAFDKKLVEESQPKAKPFDSRINGLFENFDNTLPEEYNQYKKPEVETLLQSTKNNIKQFAFDIQKLSKQAGGHPIIEEQAVKITNNLLDRLKEELGFTPEENKLLENKSVEEIAEYYSRTRIDKMAKLNNSITEFREELKDIEKHTIGKSREKLAVIYQNELNEIEKLTSSNQNDVKIYFDKSKYQVYSINDIKTPVKTEETTNNTIDKKLYWK